MLLLFMFGFLNNYFSALGNPLEEEEGTCLGLVCDAKAAGY